MTFAKWAPEALITAYEDQPDTLVKEAFLRLGNHADMEKFWSSVPDSEKVVAMLKVAAIFYWQTHGLDNPSIHANDIKAMCKHIEELQSLMKHTFGVNDDKLHEALGEYKKRIKVNRYEEFYAVPRQQLLWALYRFTNTLYGKPHHSLVAILASVIANETLSKEDVQPTYRKLQGRKSA